MERLSPLRGNAGVLRCAQDDDEKDNGKDGNDKKKKQIPRGNDSKKGKGNGNGKCKNNGKGDGEG